MQGKSFFLFFWLSWLFLPDVPPRSMLAKESRVRFHVPVKARATADDTLT
jgi:hypothetical protein